MKLKFLTLLSQEKVEYKDLLDEILGLRKVRWYHTIYFMRAFRKLFGEVEVIRNLNPILVEESVDCKITRPKNLELISYGAMTELRALTSAPGDKEIGELIIETISLACFESHTKKPFDSDSIEYSNFKKLVSESDLVHMLGLHNWLNKENNESIEKWNGLFKQLEVHDEEWDNAGGSMMDKFNILNTIKKSCSAFNLSYHEVLKLPFALIQANSLSDATTYLIRDRMRVSVEGKLRTKNRE